METLPHELPWKPLTVRETSDLFAGWNRFWCVAGGWAVDLHAGRVTREHGDVDVLILHRDVAALPAQLPGWELWPAWPPGTLTRWDATHPIHPDAHDIWCRREGETVWRFQFMVMDHDATHWVYRRDGLRGGPLVTLAREIDGVPVIQPEIQLLYKGDKDDRRPKDEADFRTLLSHLTADQREWLRQRLARHRPHHPWIAALDR